MDYDRLTQPLILIIFGITGDLAQRYQLPALYQLAKAGQLPAELHIIGVSRRAVATKDVFAKLPEFANDADYDEDIANRLMNATEMHEMDLLDKSAYEDLLTRLAAIESECSPGASRLYYLSIPSHAFPPIVRLLGETNHNAPIDGGHDAPRLLIEKPFGYDLRSAKELIELVDQYFGEGQVYRIDHYVAKETVQNVLVFRFQNPLFESIWNNKHIDHISVVQHEKIDIEGRANFYEQTGALRDLIQSHLLQMLALTTMNRPPKLDSDGIHAEKLKLLEAIQPIPANEVGERAVRGQYEGYRAEVENTDSNVETFARVKLWIDNEQWTGVPMVLETGKALTERLTEIVVCFRQPEDAPNEQNKLIFRIQPREGITLHLQTKRPGIKTVTEGADMDFDYERAFSERSTGAYERVLVDAIRGDQTLFASSGEVIRSWEIIENVLQQWSHNDAGLVVYPKGSVGPGPARQAADV